MANATVPSAPVKRRHWLRLIMWILLALILLLVVVYFVATSSLFFKGVILPRAGKAMNANITVSDADISPFSHVVLRNLKVQTTGAEPLLTAAEARARYNLRDIMGGKINVQELRIDSPVVQIVHNPDATSNLDPLVKAKPTAAPAQEHKPEQPPPSQKPAKPSKPAQLDIAKVMLNNATVRILKNYTNGAHDVTELSNLNLSLNDLKN